MTYQTPTKPKKKRTGLKVAGGVVGLLVVLVLCSVATSEGEQEAAPSPQSEVTLIEGTPGEGPTLPSLLPPSDDASEPDVPREFDNALRSAQQYIDIMAFSSDGLYDQLTSEYGEGFTPDAAQYAVDNVDADWNAEAVESAEGYLEIMPMSRQELVDQLTSEYGEGFTPEQAEHAVSTVY